MPGAQRRGQARTHARAHAGWPGAPLTLPAATVPQSHGAGARLLGKTRGAQRPGQPSSPCQSSVGSALPGPPCPSLGGGTYLRRLSRPCLLEFLLRSAGLLIMPAAARLAGDLA